MFDYGATKAPKTFLVIAKKEKVIGISEVGSVRQPLSDQMVQRIEKEVTPQLACQISDGHPAWTLDAFHPVVTRK